MNNQFERAPQPSNDIELVKKAIMTAQEYAGIEHDRPYIYEVENHGKKITYFGVGHSWDPNNPVWSQMKEKFLESNPDLVIVEGVENIKDKQEIIEKAKDYSEEEVIGRHGEAGLALKLALEKGIDYDSPEPNDSDLMKHLLESGFSREEVFTQQFFLMIPQWQQYSKKEDFKDFAKKVISRFKKDTNWDNFEYTYAHIEEIARKIWGEEVNLEDVDYYHDKVDPIPWKRKKSNQTVINEISRQASLYRDQYMIEKIAEYLNDHDTIFIVFGASHAVMQEPAIRKLMKSN